MASTSYTDLGYTYGTPVIAEADTGSVVIVGNGYRNEGSGHAVLYVINPDTGALLKAIDAFVRVGLAAARPETQWSFHAHGDRYG